MLDKLKSRIKGKFIAAKEWIAEHKIAVCLLALFVVAFAALIVVTATMSDAGRLRYSEKADGTLEAEIRDTYRDGWFCREELTVPERVRGKLVTSIADIRSEKLQKIVLPDSVEEIKQEAFSGCSSLREIDLGNSLQIIGDRALENCTSLHEIVLPDSVQTVGAQAFSGCVSLREIVLGSSLQIIGDRALENCTSLHEIVLPDSVQTVGAQAFSGCSSLREIDLGNSLQIIGDRALENCTSLHEIVLPDSVQTVGAKIFDGTPIRYNEYGGLNYVGNERNPYLVLIGAENAALNEIRVHEDTKAAAASAFEGLKGIVSADTANLDSLPDRMFANCDNLREITFGENLLSIGDRAFSDCDNLSEITFGANLNSIGAGAFYKCDKLEKAHFKNPNGWSVSRSTDMTGAIEIAGLDDPATAALSLKKTYCNYVWKREAEKDV